MMRQKGGILSTNKAKFWNKSQAKGYGHAEVDIAGGEEEYEERPLHGPRKRRIDLVGFLCADRYDRTSHVR